MYYITIEKGNVARASSKFLECLIDSNLKKGTATITNNYK